MHPRISHLIPSDTRAWLQVLLFAALYALAGWLGLRLAYLNDHATLVWVPSGLALVLLVRHGSRFWPAVWLGAWLVNRDLPALTNLALASGNTLEALLGAWALRRIKLDVTFSQVRDVLLYCLVPGLLTTLVSAAIGPSSLWLGGRLAIENLGAVFLVWWLGDALGVILAGPFLFQVWGRTGLDWLKRHGFELLWIGGFAVGLSLLVFRVDSWGPAGLFGFKFLLFPLVILAGIRLGHAGVGGVVLICTTHLVSAVLSHGLPAEHRTQMLAFIGGYLLVLALVGYIVAALVGERKRVDRQRESSRRQLEAMVENFPGPVFLTSPDGLLLQANHAYAEILGTPLDQLLCRNVFDGLTERAIARRRHADAIVLRDRRPLQLEVEGDLPHNGDRLYLMTKFAVQLGEHGETGICTITSDITQLRRAEHLAHQAEARFKALVESSLAGIFVTHNRHYEYVNQHLADMFGYTPEELIGRRGITLVHPKDQHQTEFYYRQRMSGATDTARYQFRGIRKDGSIFPCEVHSRLFQFEGRATIIGLMLDVSERAKAEREQRLAAKVFENAMEGILITDHTGVIMAVNHAFERITGYPQSEVLGKMSRMFNEASHGHESFDAMRAQLSSRGHWEGEVLDRRKNGATYPAWLSISCVRDESGDTTNFAGVFSDITSRKEAEERLYYLANHDSLTDLPNRTQMQAALTKALNRMRRGHGKLAVLFIDLDRFKVVNDTMGHDTGDKLLQAVALRLRQCLRDSDLVARLGGDEFTVLMENVDDVQAVAQVGEKLLQALGAPFVVESQELYVTASIGVAMYPDDGHDVSTLLRNADLAMYRAKELGKNAYQFYATEMNAEAFEHLVMENHLRHALERGEFELHYQPQVNLSNGAICGVEALIRWRHPELGLVPPNRFISLAEENGLIIPIGEWVLRTACLQARRWQEAGLPRILVAVNLSARQFVRDVLVRFVARTLHETGLDPAYLELEITESLIMRNPEEAISILDELKRMGVQISIDDFGTGYSSLSILKRFPLHGLKIDRSFLIGLPQDEDNLAIAEAILALASRLKLIAVAEGIETEAQLTVLREQGCDRGQGFLFSRPVPADQLEILLRRGQLFAVES